MPYDTVANQTTEAQYFFKAEEIFQTPPPPPQI